MFKRFIEWLKLELRPYEHCEGRGCYVFTKYRNADGRPYCDCCKDEGAELRE